MTDQSGHYLERELSERMCSDPCLLDFLARSSLDGLWYWDLENPDHEWMSPRLWELLGYEASEKAHLVAEWQSVIFPEDLQVALANLDAHLADPNHPYDQIARYRHKDGSTAWVRCRGMAIRDEAGRPIRMLGAHNDVTALKRAEETARELNESLEARVAERAAELERAHRENLRLREQSLESQRLESLAMLAGGLAHDFNNLLTVILGNARLISDDCAADSPIRTKIDRVRKAGETAAHLVEQITTYAGRSSVSLQPTEISEVIAGIRDLVRASVNGRAVLELRLAEGLPCVLADAAQLRQVVLNLVANASEAFDESQGTIRVVTGTLLADEAFLADSVATHDVSAGRYVFLEVSDTGRGLDCGQPTRCFEPFYSTKFMGRGLGLAVVQGIVARHEGTITVSPTPGGGTTFTVLFPIAAEVAAKASADRPATRSAAAHATVLVVDDEDWVRELAEAFLTRAGFEVITASGGAKAIDLVHAEPDAVDAVVLDLTMPEMNGEETFRELRRLRADLPIILATGYSDDIASRRIGAEGLRTLLRKPYEPEDLIAAVRDALSA